MTITLLKLTQLKTKRLITRTQKERKKKYQKSCFGKEKFMKDSNLKQIFTPKPENVLGTKEDPRQILPPNQELGKLP